MIPTDEQIKEFWEKVGQYKECGYCKGTGRIYDFPPQNIYHQCRACNGNGCFRPPIDLDNLFQYAMPKVIEMIMAEQECSSDLAYAILFKKWLQKLELDIPNHEGTLFEVCWEVIKDGRCSKMSSM